MEDNIYGPILLAVSLQRSAVFADVETVLLSDCNNVEQTFVYLFRTIHYCIALFLKKIWSKVAHFIPATYAVYLKMREWKNYNKSIAVTKKANLTILLLTICFSSYVYSGSTFWWQTVSVHCATCVHFDSLAHVPECKVVLVVCFSAAFCG